MAFLKRSRQRESGATTVAAAFTSMPTTSPASFSITKSTSTWSLSTIVEEAHALVGPGCFLNELRMNIALQNRPERPPVYPEPIKRETPHCGKETRVHHMQFASSPGV